MKKSYRHWIILAAVALIGSVAVQVIWIVKGYDQAEMHLHDQLENALTQTIEDLTLAEDIAFISQIESRDGDSNRVKVVEYRFVKDSNTEWNATSDHIIEEQIHLVSGAIHEASDGVDSEEVGELHIEVHTDHENGGLDTVIEDEDVMLEDVLQMERDGRLRTLMRRIRVENIKEQNQWTNRIDSTAIHAKLQENLIENALDVPFAFAVSNSRGETFAHMVTKPFDKDQGITATAPLFPTDLRSKDVVLEVQIATGFGTTFKEIGWLAFFSFLFTLTMLLLFVLLWKQLLSQTKLSQMKSDFIGNMSHELRTPLATISLAADSIVHPKNQGDSAVITPLVQTIKREHDRIHRHVDRVLQMAHADQGNFPLERKDLQLPDWLTQIVEGYTQRAQREDKSIVLHSEAEEINVNWDELHMRGAIENLIDNALNYNPQGTEVKVKFRQDNDRVFIDVVDNGVGISTEEQERVFDRFYRSQKGNLHTVKGFGLGLNYVQLVCRAHGGTLGLKSKKGEGSTFTIHIPTHG